MHVVIGHGGEQVQAAISDKSIHWCTQGVQLGTGHAVQQALPGLPEDNNVVVLYGDVPLLTSSTLQLLVEKLAK